MPFNFVSGINTIFDLMNSFKLLVFYLVLIAQVAWSQQAPVHSSASYSDLEFTYLYGTILQHNPDISHLITGHPTAIMLRYNRKTFGDQEWEYRYNYPDWGVSAVFQDLKNQSLGDAYGIYAHYNFYFLKRNLQLSIGQGVAWMTNPFDPVTNHRNTAYGTRITSSTYFGINYIKQRIFKRIGLQAGINLIHYSNANVKAPNNSTNSILFNLGVNYDLSNQPKPNYKTWQNQSIKDKWHINAVARFGVNECDIRGSGQFPFYTFSFYADKRLSFKSSLHVGTELMVSEFLKEYRDYLANSFPNSGLTGNENHQRIGVFVGYELHIGQWSAIAQLGYYVYGPIKYETPIYNRIGLQRRMGKDFFASLSLKAHGAAAEGVSIGIGYRL